MHGRTHQVLKECEMSSSEIKSMLDKGEAVSTATLLDQKKMRKKANVLY